VNVTRCLGVRKPLFERASLNLGVCGVRSWRFRGDGFSLIASFVFSFKSLALEELKCPVILVFPGTVTRISAALRFAVFLMGVTSANLSKAIESTFLRLERVKRVKEVAFSSLNISGRA